MSLLAGRCEAFINGGPVLPCEFRIEQEQIPISTALPYPDKDWSFTDAAGHFHAFNDTPKEPDYPTLRTRTRHVDCDGSYCGGVCGGEGFDTFIYECRLCFEEINPGLLHGERHWTEPGMRSWTVVIHGAEPTQDEVSLRIRRGPDEMFGIAQPTGFTASSGSAGQVEFSGVGPLGHRKADLAAKP